MDLGPWKQESRHGPGYSSVSPSRPGLTCSRALDFGDWLFPVAVCAVSFQSCLQALDPLDLATLFSDCWPWTWIFHSVPLSPRLTCSDGLWISGTGSSQLPYVQSASKAACWHWTCWIWPYTSTAEAACFPTAEAVFWPWTWVPGGISLSGSFPRPGSLAPAGFGIRGRSRRQPMLPAGHGLGSLET
jgi:hypothetical protein